MIIILLVDNTIYIIYEIYFHFLSIINSLNHIVQIYHSFISISMN